MTEDNTTNSNSAIFGIYRLLIVYSTILTLYFAQTILKPLTLAALLAFLLSPLVAKLEKWIGRVFSILLVVLLVFTITGLGGYVFTKQLAQFGSNFQHYSENIQIKLQTIQFPNTELFNRIGDSLSSFKEGLLGESKNAATTSNLLPADFDLIDFSSHFINLIESFFGSFFNILQTSAIVLLLVIFMLLNREDVRARIIKLTGQNKMSSATNAMDDVSQRLYVYLSRQFIVNIGFGITVLTGLYFIGIPNAILWGCLAGILRFIPYIGSWIATIIPIALSFIITTTWSVPLLTIFFFIIIEVITAYIIEPHFYGIGTGVSSFALILAAIFWTWLWGPLGLLLSTPLTVCLAVIGQYGTRMSFLSTLLSQEQA